MPDGVAPVSFEAAIGAAPPAGTPRTSPEGVGGGGHHVDQLGTGTKEEHGQDGGRVGRMALGGGGEGKRLSCHAK